jgi:hypothetical protein
MKNQTKCCSVRDDTSVSNDPYDCQVRLQYDRAFQLLDSLERLNLSAESDIDVEQFRSCLEDACWLAQWKREYVLLDEEKISVPLLEEMLSTLRDRDH